MAQWSLILRTSSAHEEGGVRDYSIQTTAFGGGGAVERLHAVRVVPQQVDGRMRFVPVEGSDFTIEADLVLLATGFVHPVHRGLIEEPGVDLDERGNVRTNDDYQTSVPGVFAGSLTPSQAGQVPAQEADELALLPVAEGGVAIVPASTTMHVRPSPRARPRSN